MTLMYANKFLNLRFKKNAMNKDKKTNGDKHHPPSSELQRNRDQQTVDKAPGDERNKAEKVKPEDLKGKKMDVDPSQESGRPG
jgi:hypothetical protein